MFLDIFYGWYLPCSIGNVELRPPGGNTAGWFSFSAPKRPKCPLTAPETERKSKQEGDDTLCTSKDFLLKL